MNRSRTIAAGITIALLLAAAGCARETPSRTEADVTKAEAAGAEDVAGARTDATATVAEAQKNVSDTQDVLARKTVDANQALAIAEAQATHKVALERCESQAGEARAACKKLADIELSDATARADAIKAAAYPNG